jgi:hypothetical protein
MSNTLAEPAEPELQLPNELEQAVQPEVMHKRKRLPRGERQEFNKKIRDLKSAQRKRIKALARKHRTNQKLMQKKLKEQAIKSRKDRERDLAHAKKNYQFQLEQIRQFYFERNAALQDELKGFFAAQLEEVRKGYGEVTAASSQTQLQMLEKWLKDEFLREMRERAVQVNKAEIEQARLNGQLQVGKLIEQLEERNLEVEVLKQKVQQLGRHAPEGMQEQTGTPDIHEVFGYQDESQKQELLSVIKEIAEEQQAMQDAGDEPKQPFWGRFRPRKQKAFSEPDEV